MRTFILVILFIIFIGYAYQFRDQQKAINVIEKYRTHLFIDNINQIIIVDKDTFKNHKDLQEALNAYKIEFEYKIKIE